MGRFGGEGTPVAGTGAYVGEPRVRARLRACARGDPDIMSVIATPGVLPLQLIQQVVKTVFFIRTPNVFIAYIYKESSKTLDKSC